MKNKTRQSGLTLAEMIVVVSIVAMFAVLAVPAFRAFLRSVECEGGAKAMISASLSSARAIAAREQHYAGIRFQNKYQPDGKGCQYMIFIIYDFDKTGLANGFRAVDGVTPIKLPDSVGVMDLKISGNIDIGSDSDISLPADVNDTTTFSIIFSPSGKLVIHDVQVRNRDGDTGNGSQDDVFNTKSNVQNGIGMFFQDDYLGEGFYKEPSRNSFIIYDKTVFEKLNPGRRYTDYLQNLEVVYINPYTGAIINK
jgi:prepilin-type N-terminal cleavage/methylation domain-containing protein